MSGEIITSYHTVEANTRKRAEKKRDELILKLERKGAACTSQMTLKEFLDEFIKYKEEGGLIERSTINHYRKHAKVVCRYLGGHRLADVNIPAVNGWMAQMVSEGYAPRSVSKCFGLLKQAMKYAVALDLITKNPCEFCKPPKISRKKLQVLDRDERTRMLQIARAAEPSPLALAIELALTTGMRRGEICGLRRRWLVDADGNAVGYVTGAALANETGITEQVPATVEVATNSESTRVREVAGFGGWRKVVLRRPRTKVTDDNVDALRFLDLITAEPVSALGDAALEALRKLAAKAGRAAIYENAGFYPAKTSKRLVECEVRDVFA